MRTFLILLSLISSTIGFEVECSCQTQISVQRQSVASYYDTYSFVEDNGYIQIGYEQNVISPSMTENRYYTSFIRIDFPKVSNISSMTLSLHKASGNIVNIGTYYYGYDLDFDNNTTFSASGFLGVTYSNTNVFNINLTNAAQSALSNNRSYFYISIGMSYSGGYGDFYYQSDDDSNNPTMSISTTDVPISNTYGSAEMYDQIYHDENLTNFAHSNCCSYALNIYREGIFYPYIEYGRNQLYYYGIENDIVEKLIRNSIAEHGFIVRIIDSYDSPIYANERRIAARLLISSGLIYSYHFLKQLDDGCWAGKEPDDVSYYYNNGNPTSDFWNSRYNSKTMYFAIERK